VREYRRHDCSAVPSCHFRCDGWVHYSYGAWSTSCGKPKLWMCSVGGSNSDPFENVTCPICRKLLGFSTMKIDIDIGTHGLTAEEVEEWISGVKNALTPYSGKLYRHKTERNRFAIVGNPVVCKAIRHRLREGSKFYNYFPNARVW